MKIDSYHLSWIIGINGNSQINKTLRRKLLEVNLCDLDLENIFFSFFRQSTSDKRKKKWALPKFKTFMLQTILSRKQKRQPDGEKIFVTYI